MRDILMVPALQDYEIEALKRDIARGRWRRRVPLILMMRALATIGHHQYEMRMMDNARRNAVARAAGLPDYE